MRTDMEDRRGQVFRIHPLGTTDICTKFHTNLSDRQFTKNHKCRPHDSARGKVR